MNIGDSVRVSVKLPSAESQWEAEIADIGDTEVALKLTQTIKSELMAQFPNRVQKSGLIADGENKWSISLRVGGLPY